MMVYYLCLIGGGSLMSMVGMSFVDFVGVGVRSSNP